MSAEHRKPLAAFIALAFVAAVLVGVQRADAQTGRFLAAVLGPGERVQAVLPGLSRSMSVGARGDEIRAGFGGTVVVREPRTPTVSELRGSDAALRPTAERAVAMSGLPGPASVRGVASRDAAAELAAARAGRRPVQGRGKPGAGASQRPQTSPSESRPERSHVPARPTAHTQAGRSRATHSHGQGR